jgi:hypothetical protein
VEENSTILFKIKTDDIKKNSRVKEYLKTIFLEQEKILRTYLQKHIKIKNFYKPKYKINDLNSNNRMKILDGVVKNCVKASLNRNRLLSRGRGINEMRLSSCKLRIENLNKNCEEDFSTLNLKDTFDNNFNNNEISLMQKFSVKAAPQSANIIYRNSQINKGSSLYYATSDNNPNFALNKLNSVEKAAVINRSSLIFAYENEENKNNFNNGISRLNRNSSVVAQQLSLNVNQRRSMVGNINNAAKVPHKGSSIFLNFKKATCFNVNNLRKNYDLIEEEESKQNNNRPMSVVSKFRIDPSITKSASKWVSYKKSLDPKYSTGHFSLPLVSKLFY